MCGKSTQHEAIDRHTVGRCFYCGKEFEYTIKAEFLKKHPNITEAIQLYCSPNCEHESQRELAKLRAERERQKPKPREKFCPKCGFVPKTMHQKSRWRCRNCNEPFSWREVKEEVKQDVIENAV